MGQSSQVRKGNVQESKKAYRARIATFKSYLKAIDFIEAKNEVERYLGESHVDGKDSFNVLDYLKFNVFMFPFIFLVL